MTTATAPLEIGSTTTFVGDRFAWTVRAVQGQWAIVTRQAQFRAKGTMLYSIIDTKAGVRGPCNRVGQGWGDGSYDDAQVASMMSELVAGKLEISGRNNVKWPTP